MSRRPSSRVHGFTLVELMVVVAIIGILVSILLPALGRFRTQAKVTQCAANLRSMAGACLTYASANKRHYPGLAMPGTGGNLWDVSIGFHDALVKEGMPHSAFFCPALTDMQTAEDTFNSFKVSGKFYIVSYNVWIQRRNGSVLIPLEHDNPPPPGFKLVSPAPTSPFAGPMGAGDEVAATNPIFTDIVGSKGVDPAADADLSRANNPYGMSGLTNHQQGGRLVSINAAFADGHVETRAGNTVHPWYSGNWWNWR
jgi:prepilin-type N-terminal cleavage/methylation domain-containing protein/prepilin-type processing-associated H-X9-DG protein